MAITSGFLARQPNGKLCRFSTIVDTVTHYNMTNEEYIQLCIDEAKKQAMNTLENTHPFEEVKKYFRPTNMSNTEFDEMLKEMGDVGLFDYLNTEPIDVEAVEISEEENKKDEG